VFALRDFAVAAALAGQFDSPGAAATPAVYGVLMLTLAAAAAPMLRRATTTTPVGEHCACGSVLPFEAFAVCRRLDDVDAVVSEPVEKAGEVRAGMVGEGVDRVEEDLDGGAPLPGDGVGGRPDHLVADGLDAVVQERAASMVAAGEILHLLARARVGAEGERDPVGTALTT
jgi:hypothetical protein